MHPVLFKIGPVTIATYGLFVSLGVIAGYLFSLKGSSRCGISANKISDLLFVSLASGFITARVFYILINWDYFIQAPMALIFSRSGFVFYGGLIGGGLAGWIFVQRNKLPALTVLDLIAPAVALGHSLGRLGCFSYGCCYGKPTSSFIGMVFPAGSPAGIGEPVIPTQLISSFFLLVIFFLLLFVRDRKKFEGQVFLSYLFLYGLFRFIIEFYRGDPRGYWGIFSVSQWISLFLIGVSGIFFIKKFIAAGKK